MSENIEEKTRAQKAKELHAKNTKERARTQEILKSEYFKIKDSEALQDLKAKVQGFLDYHLKIAKDGVGFKEVKLVDGSMRQEVVYFNHEQRVTHLDKAAGLEEIIDYLDRQLS